MIVVLERGVTQAQADAVLSELERLGLRGRRIGALESPLIHVIEGASRKARMLQYMDGVEGLVPTPGPRIRARGRYFFPYHAINWISLVLVVFGVLITLAGFLPPGVGEDIDPLGVAPVTSIPWYLRAPHAFVARGWIGSTLLAAFCLLLFLLPRLERSTGEKSVGRIAVSLASVLLFACWLFLTF